MKRYVEVIGYLVCWPPVGLLRDSESKKQALEGGMSGQMTLDTPCRVCLLQYTLEAERGLFVVCTLFERKESDGEMTLLQADATCQSTHSCLRVLSISSALL